MAHRLPVPLSPEVLRALRERAALSDRSLAYVASHAIAEWLRAHPTVPTKKTPKRHAS